LFQTNLPTPTSALTLLWCNKTFSASSGVIKLPVDFTIGLLLIDGLGFVLCALQKEIEDKKITEKINLSI
jgi:hypothetical protein